MVAIAAVLILIGSFVVQSMVGGTLGTSIIQSTDGYRRFMSLFHLLRIVIVLGLLLVCWEAIAKYVERKYAIPGLPDKQVRVVAWYMAIESIFLVGHFL